MRTGCQTPRISVAPPAVSRQAADDVAQMAAMAGMTLDPWQRLVLDAALGETADKRWAAFEAALVVPRQAGKSALLEAMILAALFVWEERTVIYSAHIFATAQETFMRLRSLIEASEFADEVAKVYTANGKESIILKNGCRVKFMARSKGGGRGFSGDRIIFDEAYDLSPKALGAMVPTLAARSMRGDSNPQIWYASSAAHSDSVVLHSLRKRAALPDPGRLAYLEWSAPDGTDPDDVDAWYQANPALGIRISEDFVRDERQALAHTPGEFIRERLGIPDPEPDDATARDVKLPADAWARTVAAPPDIQPGALVLTVDATPGGEWASIAIGAGSLSSPYVEVIEHRKGLGWVPARMVELVAKWSPLVVGVDGGGPAGALVGPLMAALADAGVSTDLVRQMPTVDMKQACEGFFTDVLEGRLRRPDGQGPLDVAVSDACERRVGDGWLWDRRSATVPICPLVAVTIARSLLLADGDEARPIFAA